MATPMGQSYREYMMSKKVEKDSDRSYLSSQLLDRDNETTPDFLERKLEKYIPVFVYGTLKAGGRLHGVLSNAGAPCLGDAHTATPTYTMKQADAGFPVIFGHQKATDQTHHVFGEVYVVNAKLLLELDRIEGNGEMYQRDKRWVFLLDQTFKGKSTRPAVKAWVYVGMPEFWDGVPLVNVSPKRGKTNDFYDWQGNTKSNLLYAPKSDIKPEVKPAANYMSSYPDMNGDNDDGLWQDIMIQDQMDWKEYDEAMAKRKMNPDVPWTI